MAGLNGSPIEHLSGALAFIRSVLSVGNGPASGRPVKVTGSMVVRLCLPVTELGGDVALARRAIAVPAFQIPLSGPSEAVCVGGCWRSGTTRQRYTCVGDTVANRVFQPAANPRGIGTVFGRIPSIPERKSSIARRISTGGRRPVTVGRRIFAATSVAKVLGTPGFNRRAIDEISGSLARRRCIPAIRLRAVPSRSIEIPGGVVLCLRFAIAQLGGRITLVRCQVAFEPFDVAVSGGPRHRPDDSRNVACSSSRHRPARRLSGHVTPAARADRSPRSRG